MADHEHERYLSQAIELSRRAVDAGNNPYGAVLVRGGEVVATGLNTTQEQGDITRHAELNLVSELCVRESIGGFSGATLYASTEPCPMCAGAIALLPIRTLVFGCSVAAVHTAKGLPHNGYRCRDVLGLRPDLEVVGPLLEDEALAVHRGPHGG